MPEAEAQLNRSDEEARRKRRHELARQFAREVAGWSSHKLRMAYAQPETVRAAEERERSEADKRPTPGLAI